MLHVESGEGKLHVTIVFLSNCAFLFFSSCLTYADLMAFGVMTLIITNTILLLYLFYFTFNLGFNASLLFKNVVSFALQCLLLLFMKNNPIWELVSLYSFFFSSYVITLDSKHILIVFAFNILYYTCSLKKDLKNHLDSEGPLTQSSTQWSSALEGTWCGSWQSAASIMLDSGLVFLHITWSQKAGKQTLCGASERKSHIWGPARKCAKMNLPKDNRWISNTTPPLCPSKPSHSGRLQWMWTLSAQSPFPILLAIPELSFMNLLISTAQGCRKLSPRPSYMSRASDSHLKWSAWMVTFIMRSGTHDLIHATKIQGELLGEKNSSSQFLKELKGITFSLDPHT